jgi:hypothetical protein
MIIKRGYSVAISNQGGGYLVLGVRNIIDQKIGKRPITGTDVIQNIQKAKYGLYEVLNKKVEIF